MTVESTLGAARPSPSRWRHPGVWIAVALGAAMIWNAARAGLDPHEFAAGLGLPISSGAVGFVHVYALRALSLGLVAWALVAAGELRALAIFALAEIPMPAGDALLTAAAGAPPETVARHIAYVATLLVCAWFLRRHLLRSGS